jgi:hypothetical protein
MMEDTTIFKIAVVLFAAACLAWYVGFLLTHHCVASHVEMRTECYGGKTYMNCDTRPVDVCDAWEEDQ